jgi:hypothetical protein
MTQLTNQSFQSVYGDLLTTTNNGGGLSSFLQNLQDGFGNNSTITISLNAVNFNRSGPNTFQLDSVALTAPAANINAICGNSPAFTGNFPLQLPTGTTAQRPGVPENGMIWYNTTLNKVEAFSNGSWVQIT